MRISRFCRLIYFCRPEDGFVSHFSHLRGFEKRRYHVGFTTYQSIFNDSISSRTHFRIHTHRQHQQCNLCRIVQMLNLSATFSLAEWILSPKTITNKRSLFSVHTCGIRPHAIKYLHMKTVMCQEFDYPRAYKIWCSIACKDKRIVTARVHTIGASFSLHDG